MMQQFNRLAIPGTSGCPARGALCCFWLKQDQFFLGFIPASGNYDGVQVYTSTKRIPLELIKAYQLILNEQNAAILITTDHEQPERVNLKMN